MGGRAVGLGTGVSTSPLGGTLADPRAGVGELSGPAATPPKRAPAPQAIVPATRVTAAASNRNVDVRRRRPSRAEAASRRSTSRTEAFDPVVRRVNERDGVTEPGQLSFVEERHDTIEVALVLVANMLGLQQQRD